MGKHRHHHQRCPRHEDDIIDRLLKHCPGFEGDRERTLGAHFSREEACRIAKVLGVNIESICFDIEEFQLGLNVELEHGLRNPSTNITNNDPILTGKIALAHLNRIPDYYTRLLRMRREALDDWRRIRRRL